MSGILDLFGGGVLSPQSNEYEQRLRGSMTGTGPSLAQTMLQAQTAQAQRQLSGLAARGSGVNSALAQRNAMVAGTELMGQNAESAAQARAREQMMAEQQFGELSNKREAAMQSALGSGVDALGGLAQTAAPLLLASDEDVKTPAGDGGARADAFLRAISPESFRYTERSGEATGPTHLGVMAQDVARAMPSAVEEDPQGVKRVDVAQLSGANAAAVARLHERLARVEAMLSRFGGDGR